MAKVKALQDICLELFWGRSTWAVLDVPRVQLLKKGLTVTHRSG